ncbi:alpha/beta fold hydrolase, partial [Streptomyces sp. NPDC056728]
WGIMNIVLWITAGLLAASFLFSGVFKLAPSLAQRKLSMPVLAIGSTHSGTATAQALAPHADHVQGAVAPTGHFVAEEGPNWFTKTLTTFLA